MTTLNRPTAAQTAPTTAGLIMSLASSLPNPNSALARRAMAVAAHGDPRECADILAALLDATDYGMALADDNCLDEEWDA